MVGYAGKEGSEGVAEAVQLRRRAAWVAGLEGSNTN